MTGSNCLRTGHEPDDNTADLSRRAALKARIQQELLSEYEEEPEQRSEQVEHGAATGSIGRHQPGISLAQNAVAKRDHEDGESRTRKA